MDDPAFAPEVDENAQTILLHASNHDLAALKPFLRIPGNASVQDPETGFTPLHAAIAACGPASPSVTSPNTHDKNENGKRELAAEDGKGEEGEEEVDIDKAIEVVKELFLSGAIWNDLDSNDETPGCLAWRLERKELYNLCVDAGFRAEILLGLMGKYEALDSGSESGDSPMLEEENGVKQVVAEENEEVEVQKKDVNSEDYLASELKFEDGKLLDEDKNGVMMAWETDIMRRSVDALLSPEDSGGKRVLNIGFGMGIIDKMFKDTKPLSHHIVEAHPAVLKKLKEEGSEFGETWKSSAPEGGRYVVHEGRWQDILPSLLESGETFDAMYFDTFGEDYSALKEFFSEFVPGLLDEGGKFGFFNGLGADRRVCYDVYTKVVECDLTEAGLDVEWTDVPVGKLGEEGEGEWEGVRRRYWVLENYRLPACTFLG